MNIIRKFNDDGILAFEKMLDSFRETKKIDSNALTALLIDDRFSIELSFKIISPKQIGNNKFEIAKLLSETLDLENNPKLYYDKGLWSWLGAYLLETIVPIKKNTSDREFREKALYILESNNWTKYYRHLLSFPCWVYAELKEKGKIFLRGDIHERGEIVEQLASVHEIQRNKSIIEAATLLFYNSKNNDIFKGVASKNKGGTARRFRDVIQQLKLTFDLNAMGGIQIVKILPDEFKKWH